MANPDLSYRFGDFRLDVSNRQLWRGEERLDLNARYFDALVLLVREHGQLIEKDRFFDDVWSDVIVSDSALTQCIKDIRKQIGDTASNPRFIETVPRYGYRFIAPVESVQAAAIDPQAEALASSTAPAEPSRADDPSVLRAALEQQALRRTAEPATADASATSGPGESLPLQAALLWGGAGALGGGFAGVLGGLLYGSALAYTPADPALGTTSVLIVLLSLNVLVGLVGGLGVSVGMAAVGWGTRRALRWSITGAALGGLIVGGGAKLVGVDAFTLLFGQAPSGITGGLEGATLGAALALGARLGSRFDVASARRSASASWRPVVGAGLAGAAAGALIPAAGGHLMGGSLERVARSFGDSQLQLDALGQFFGEMQFGTATQVALGSIEGLLFGSCVAGALVLARRALVPG